MFAFALEKVTRGDFVYSLFRLLEKLFMGLCAYVVFVVTGNYLFGFFCLVI